MPPDSETLLFCGLSGRAFAQSARAAGFLPVVLDAFADTDTVEAAAAIERVPFDADWRFEEGPLLDAARRLAPPPVPLVWGSGLERHQDLVAMLAEGRELLGCHPAQVRRLKNPNAFAAMVEALNIPHPEIRSGPPSSPEGWLRKRIGGAGGIHIRAAATTDTEVPGWYFQRRVAGSPVAALILGSHDDAELLGLSEQWTADGSTVHPFRYGGAAAPARLPPTVAAELAAASLALARAADLRGLASIDFLVASDGSWHLLEVNPRLGGSLDVYERTIERGLIARHVAACRGRKLPPWTPPRSAAASTLVYARTDLVPIPPGMVWPEWAADRTPPGETVHRGQPICTVFGEGADAGEARSLAALRSAAILDRLERPDVPDVTPAAGCNSIFASASPDARWSNAPHIAGW